MADCIHNEVRQMVGSSRLVRKTGDIALVTRNELEMGALLGKGAFSEVHEVVLTNDPNRKRYAMKHLKFKLMTQPENFRLAASELAAEAHMLASFDHPNILKIRGWAANGVASFVEGAHDSFFLLLDCLDETLDQRISQWKAEEDFLKRRSQQQMAMGGAGIMDMWRWMSTASQDDHHHHPHSHPPNSRKSEEEMQLLLEKFQACGEIASALAYLHESGVIFRDLKPNNIGFLNGRVQLFDFGLSRELPNCDLNEPFEMSGKVGTLRYMAVEVASHSNYNVSADVFSWAMVAYEVWTGTKPFAGWTREMHADLVCHRGMRPELNQEDGVPCRMHPLMRACWDQEPSKRPPMRAVVSQVGYVWDDLQRQHQARHVHPQQQQPQHAQHVLACLPQQRSSQEQPSQPQQVAYLPQQQQAHVSAAAAAAASANNNGVTVELPDDFMVTRKTSVQSENFTAATMSLSAESILDDLPY